MVKFQRRYLFRAQERQSPIFVGDAPMRSIQLPFTIEFSIRQNSFGRSGTASFRIYNLSPEVRLLLRHDEYNQQIAQRVIFEAGYDEFPLATLFDGNAYQAWSVREGSNVITTMECSDVSFAYSNGEMVPTSNFKAGTSLQAVIRAAIAGLPGLAVGALGSDTVGVLPRGNSYAGHPVEVIDQAVGGNFAIFNGKVYCLNDKEAILGQIQTIDASTGLLNTPVRQLNLLNVEMLFEPRLKMFQQVLLKSEDPSFNGSYKVISLEHRGIISPTVSGSATTKVGLAPGDFILVPGS